jgi:hypothetical protein
VVDCGSGYLPDRGADSSRNSAASSLVWLSLRNLGGDFYLGNSSAGSAEPAVDCGASGYGLSLVVGGGQRHSGADDKKVFQAT